MSFRTDPSTSVAIIGDKACIYCGHSLRGVSAQDQCPECGKLAGYSLLGDHLRDVDSGWIRKVMVGINLVTGGFILLAIVRVLLLLPLFGVHESEFDTSLIRFCFSIGGWTLFALGVFLITLPETSGSLIARKRALPDVLRWSTIVCAVLWFAERWFDGRGPAMIMGYDVALSIAGLLSQSLVWLFLRRIIDRTPRREVAHLLTIFFCFTVVFCIIVSRSVIAGITHLLPSEPAEFGVHLAAGGLIILHHLAAIYPLQVTVKAIRRTVGYWDN